jgi:hypothetical protein
LLHKGCSYFFIIKNISWYVSYVPFSANQ